MTAATLPEERRIYALGLRLLAISGFSIMGVMLKLASQHGISLAEIVFWRQAFSLPIILWLVWRGSGLASLRTSRIGGHSWRTMIGMICMVLNFGALTRLPLAEWTTFGFVAPIFATLLSFLMFKEKVGLRRGAAILVGFLGVVIVAQPTGHHLDPLGMAMALSAALLVAFISFQIRELNRTEQPLTIVFWFGAFSTLLMLPAMPFIVGSHDATGWLLLLGIGTLGGIAQMGMTNSLRYAPVSTVVGMDYISLIWAVLFGWLIWDQLPGWTTWAGAVIIIASCLYILWREHKLQIERTKEIIG